jgi:hypothetical protein
VLCSNCPLKYDSEEGSSTCSLAYVGYYLTYEKGDKISEACPTNGNCAGGLQGVAPNKGYWVDRSSYDYVDRLYSCPRLTCKGGNSNGSCWGYAAYNTSQSSDADVCDADALLCTEGAIGPLCGSCDQDYVYRGETKTCVACGSAKKFAFTALGVAAAAVIALIVLAAGYRHKNPVSQFIKSMDSGSLKVLWVTYQIIMSVSWNLDIEVN